MHSLPTDGSDGSRDLFLEIVETLETQGFEDDDYQLYDYVDFDALKQVIASSDGDMAVQFTVEGIWLHVSQDGVFAEKQAEYVGE